jgi:hypothetical protein
MANYQKFSFLLYLFFSSEEVDELKVYYLFREFTVPEGVIPLIVYVPEQAQKNILQIKHQDLSFFLEGDDFDNYARMFFLSDEMRVLFMLDEFENILTIRRALIRNAESNFVSSLGLSYE